MINFCQVSREALLVASMRAQVLKAGRNSPLAVLKSPNVALVRDTLATTDLKHQVYGGYNTFTMQANWYEGCLSNATVLKRSLAL
jgi:hypothetical protein